ncbi:unnamed protein product [Caenorhabditis bovis]|uniref:Uncharacterized protein n=1 Tax=Caenorhabditis bovis TaxID=2654633 RepID=A0A8S1EVY7_9PELO|nr:unnamed protein product [Caenorhabditis bovis]
MDSDDEAPPLLTPIDGIHIQKKKVIKKEEETLENGENGDQEDNDKFKPKNIAEALSRINMRSLRPRKTDSPRPEDTARRLTKKRKSVTENDCEKTFLQPMKKVTAVRGRRPSYGLFYPHINHEPINPIEDMLRKQPPVRVDVAVSRGQNSDGPSSSSSTSAQMSPDQIRTMLGNKFAAVGVPNLIIEETSVHNMLIGCMVMNGLNRLEKNRPALHPKLCEDIYNLFNRYKVT